MSDFQPIPQHNPLAKHFRQPSIYLKLPSGGSFWPEGTLDLPLNNEIGILPMSTLDEITLKTPDALLNGQGVVNVIESCCPSIKDAWAMPSIDVDAVIIAIRIASYGNEMDFSSVCPSCNTTHDHGVDLGVILANIDAPNYSKKIEVSELKIKLKPQAYFNANKSNMIQFEEQQILRTISQAGEDVEEVKRIFDQQLKKLIELNVAVLAGSTDYIEMPDSTIVTDPKFIEEFYQNCDTKIVRAVREQLEEFSAVGGLKPIDVTCPNCEHVFPVKIEFDFASFFGKGS